MVHIRGVICIRPADVIVFDTLERFWDNLNRNANPTQRAYYHATRTRMQNCEQIIMRTYNVSLLQARNIHFIFGSTSEAIRRLQDPRIRQLLFDPENRVTLQIKEMTGATRQQRAIATVWTKDDHFTIVADWRPGPAPPPVTVAPTRLPGPSRNQ